MSRVLTSPRRTLRQLLWQPAVRSGEEADGQTHLKGEVSPSAGSEGNKKEKSDGSGDEESPDSFPTTYREHRARVPVDNKRLCTLK